VQEVNVNDVLLHPVQFMGIDDKVGRVQAWKSGGWVGQVSGVAKALTGEFPKVKRLILTLNLQEFANIKSSQVKQIAAELQVRGGRRGEWDSHAVRH
jgi:hypothetical protein